MILVRPTSYPRGGGGGVHHPVTFFTLISTLPTQQSAHYFFIVNLKPSFQRGHALKQMREVSIQSHEFYILF